MVAFGYVVLYFFGFKIDENIISGNIVVTFDNMVICQCVLLKPSMCTTLTIEKLNHYTFFMIKLVIFFLPCLFVEWRLTV